jgi:hypothetical protein
VIVILFDDLWPFMTSAIWEPPIYARSISTALTGNWHLGSTPETVPNAHGFDYFYGFNEGCTDYYSHH